MHFLIGLLLPFICFLIAVTKDKDKDKYKYKEKEKDRLYRVFFVTVAPSKS